MPSNFQRLKLKVQLIVGDEIAFGPGKADLLEAIDRTGSISAAARAMGLSYRRAWLMTDAMNRLFRESLVTTTPGGRGGASLTQEGREVLSLFRILQNDLEHVASAGKQVLVSRLATTPH